jgi:hypothetical protein
VQRSSQHWLMSASALEILLLKRPVPTRHRACKLWSKHYAANGEGEAHPCRAMRCSGAPP